MRENLKRFTIYFFILVLLISGVFAGCGKTGQVSALATVYGENIGEKDIEDFLKLIYLYMPVSEETYSQEEYAEMMKQEALWFLIESKVMEREVKRLGLKVDEGKLEQLFQQVKGELVKDIYGSEKDYQARLEELGINESLIKDFHRKTLLTELLYEHTGQDVTEEDARSYVAENPEFLEKPAQIYAFHILLENEEEAQEVRKLLEDGADFLETGKAHSIDDYVELGLIREHDPYDPDFLKAAFALQPGEISQPVKTTFGYHIIKITEKEKAGVYAFDEIKEDMLGKLKGENLQAYFQKLMSEAEVETFATNE